MEILISLFEFIMNIETHLTEIINNYGLLSYLIIFAIIFCETGLVVTPFLPGDSFLFVIGALGASGKINIVFITILIIIAAITGNIVNYHIGRFLGPKVFDSNNRFLKQEYLIRTHEFYERHGGKAIILSRFFPIIRTFAPFVAGIGKMNYLKFLTYNLVGGLSWVLIFIIVGYFFGNIPAVKQNFTLVIVFIIFASLVPGVCIYLKQKCGKSKLSK
jgi:membrane-associated protein